MVYLLCGPDEGIVPTLSGFCGFDGCDKNKGVWFFAVPPLGVVGSGGAGLAAAGQISHHSGGDGGQGVGGWLGDADGLEGEE